VRSHVGQRNHRAILGDGVHLLGGLQHLVERNGRDVERLIEPVIVEVVVSAALAHVRTHADGMQHEVDFTAQQLL